MYNVSSVMAVHCTCLASEYIYLMDEASDGIDLTGLRTRACILLQDLRNSIVIEYYTASGRQGLLKGQERLSLLCEHF